MSNVSLTTGLISGLDIAGLVDALSLNRQQAIDRVEARNQEFSVKKTAVEALEANMLTLSASIASLSQKVSFEQLSVNNGGQDQFKVSVGKTAQPGSYVFQSVQKSAAHQSLSRGFVNSDEQTIGEGKLTIAQGGFLDEPSLLETFNDGAGVRRGSIRITDRSGSSATISLANALTVDDVLHEINNSVDISVTARVVDDRFVIEDNSGSTANNLTVLDLNGGHVAEDLGLKKSVASDTLSGDSVFNLSDNFSLELVNDGLGLNLAEGAADLKITLTDDSELEINLDEAVTLADIVSAINDHEDNNGNVTAELSSGRLVLTDNTAGAGTLSAVNINNSSVTRQLGLDATAAGNVLTGNRLNGGLNSVLLRNLNGGQGVETLGEVSITDRSGQTGTIDLSGMETLSEVMEAINAATEDGTGDTLLIRAEINDRGNGLKIVDTSGETTSNLVIADQNGGTFAADFNLELDEAISEIDSGSLSMQYVGAGTSLDDYAADGGGVEKGLIRITDSAGNSGVINISDVTNTIADVILRINANDAISVTAELNETGDGFVLIDEAGGAETLKVEDFGETTTANDLRLLKDSEVGTDGKQRISSRKLTEVIIEAEDTLDTLVEKLNAAGSQVSASVFNDGSRFNSTRLSITANQTGKAGRLLIDDGGLGLDFGTIVTAQDAILRVGGNPASAFLLSSDTNSFDDVVEGIDIDLTNTSNFAAQVEVSTNTEKVVDNVQTFVTLYNQFIDLGDELTKYDSDNNQRGILQGDSIVQRVKTRIDGTLNARIGISQDTIGSLVELGIRPGADGKLNFDTERLTDLLANDLDRVKEFFVTKETGFSAKMTATLKSLTDIVDGTLTQEKNTLTSSILINEDRIEELNILLETQRSRLLNEFVQMERILGSLQSQQTALGGIKPITIAS